MSKIRGLIGHAVPAVFYIGFGSFFLLLTLRRCRDLESHNNNGRQLSYTDVYTSEKAVVLFRTSWILMTCTIIGFLVEFLYSVTKGRGHYYDALAHEVMYASYLFVAAVCYLEAKKRLLPNAFRQALSFTFLTQAIMWNEHAMMKTDMSEMRPHMLMAYVSFAAFVTFAYSAYNPKSLFAHVTGNALIILNGMWLLSAGMSKWCIGAGLCTESVVMHHYAPMIVLEALSLATVIITCTVCFLDMESYSHNEEEKDTTEYSTLSVGTDSLEVGKAF